MTVHAELLDHGWTAKGSDLYADHTDFPMFRTTDTVSVLFLARGRGVLFPPDCPAAVTLAAALAADQAIRKDQT